MGIGEVIAIFWTINVLPRLQGLSHPTRSGGTHSWEPGVLGGDVCNRKNCKNAQKAQAKDLKT